MRSTNLHFTYLLTYLFIYYNTKAREAGQVSVIGHEVHISKHVHATVKKITTVVPHCTCIFSISHSLYVMIADLSLWINPMYTAEQAMGRRVSGSNGSLSWMGHMGHGSVHVDP